MEPEPEPARQLPEPEPEPEPAPLSAKELDAVEKSLKKAMMVCENTYDTIRLDSRRLLDEQVLLKVFRDAASADFLTEPAEELLTTTLHTSTPLPVNAEMVGVVVRGSASRGRVRQATAIVHAATRARMHVPPGALGQLIQVSVREPGNDPAHDAFALYQMMRRPDYGSGAEVLPWPGVDALCRKQLELAAALTEPLVEITVNSAENERKMWLRRTAGMLCEFRAAGQVPREETMALLDAPAWPGSSVTCWQYIVERGWVNLGNVKDGVREWLSRADGEGEGWIRPTFEAKEDVMVTIQDGKCAGSAELSEFYEVERDNPSALRRMTESLDTLQQACLKYEMSKMDVHLELLLAVGTLSPTIPQLAECIRIYDRKRFMQRYGAAKMREKRAEQNLLTMDEEANSIERFVVFIQVYWRAVLARRFRTRKARDLVRIIIVQRQIRSHLLFLRMRRKISRRVQHVERKWNRLQSSFAENWSRIVAGRRVEIHVPSLSLPECQRFSGLNMAARQDIQLGRIVARAANPDVFVIFVSRVPVAKEVLEYHDSIIAAMIKGEGGAADAKQGAANSDPQSFATGLRRYHVVWPENASRFPDAMSLTQVLLYSPHCLKQISQLVQDRPSYIVPGVVGAEEKRLCAKLGVPMLANDPNVIPDHCNKTWARKLFAAVGVQTAPGTHLVRVAGNVERKREQEFERLKRMAMKKLSSLAIKRKRAYNRAVALSAVGADVVEGESHGHVPSEAESQAEVQLLEAIPGTFLSLDLAVEQKNPDEVGVWLILALTMMSNLHMPVWLLKIANHTEGRGQVAIHSKDFTGICDAIQLERRWGVQQFAKASARNAVLDFAAELALELPRLARLSVRCKGCFGDWESYWQELLRSGGVLEETPNAPAAEVIGCSATIFLQPTVSAHGDRAHDWELRHLIERRSDGAEVHGDAPVAWSFPLGGLDGTAATAGRARRKLAAERSARARRAAMQMTKLVKRVAPELARRGARGYLTLDAVAFNSAPQDGRPQPDDEGNDGRPLTPVKEERAATELWATDITFGYTDLLVELEMGHAMLQGSYQPGTGAYTIRGGSEQRCMAGCRVISPFVDKALGGRSGGIASFFRWANICGRRHLVTDDDGAPADSGPIGCQFDVGTQQGGLLSLPASAGEKPSELLSASPRRGGRVSRSLAATISGRSREAAEAMALTVVSTHTAACWAMLHSTVAWLDDTSTIGPARAVAGPAAAAQLASAARDAAGGGARPQAAPEENNLPALLELLRGLA